MKYKKDFELSEISKGRILRRSYDDNVEHYEVGNYHTIVGGWELRPDGRNTYDWGGILLYVRPESIKGSFELLEDEE